MIIFDTETSGLTRAVDTDIAKQPRIIEYFGLKVNDKTFEIEGELELLIYPGEAISQEITDITKITNAMLQGKPTFPQIFQQLATFHLGESYIVGHNISFDVDMLTFELKRIGKLLNFPWPMVHICTVEASEHLEGRRMKLADLYKHLTGNTLVDAHRARNDVMATYECLKELIAQGEFKLR